MIRVGTLTIAPVFDAALDLPTSFLYDAAASHDGHESLLIGNGRMRMTMGGFLITGGDGIVLVDAGNGLPTPSEDYGHLPASLHALGIHPDHITDVVITHLHMDHIGWVSHDGAALFRNARHWVHAADLTFFANPDNDHHTAPVPVADRLAPLEEHGLLHVIDADTAITAEVTLYEAPGHTPGSIVAVAASHGQRALLLGDLVHHPAELVDDSWRFLTDVDHDQARQTRARWAAEAERPDTVTTAAHFPGMQFGRITRPDDRPQWLSIASILVPSAAQIEMFFAAESDPS